MAKKDLSPEGNRRWLKCEPRSTHDLLKRFGLNWKQRLPEGTVRGVSGGGVVYYWIPPERASRPFEKKLGTYDLTGIQPA